MKSKKFVLAGLALLAAITMVLLPLSGCKNDTVPETPEAKQEQAGGTEGNNDSTNTEDNTSGGGDSGTVPPEAHTHTFDENRWKSDDTGHWHPATCEHTEEKGGFASHTFDWKVQTPSTDTEAGKLVKKCRTCSWTDEMEIPAGFVYIPAGTFKMGSEAEGVAVDQKPAHGVTISKGYFMGRHEVTQKEWAEVMKDNANGISESPSNFKNSPAENEEPKEGRLPVETVSWYDAVVFCNKLSQLMGLEPVYSKGGTTDTSQWGDVPTSSNDEWNKIECNWEANGYRLPTEAEWELAARGGNAGAGAWQYTYAGSDTIDDVAWYNDSKTRQVGTKKPNSLNLYDMSGNVWEWCWDWWASSIEAGTASGGAASGSNRVCRGGSWNGNANYCTVSSRGNNNPDDRYIGLGFRLVRSSSK